MSETTCPGVSARTRNPHSGVTCVAGPPTSRQTTGRPAASLQADPPPESCRLGCTSTLQKPRCRRASSAAAGPKQDAAGHAQALGQPLQTAPIRPVADQVVFAVGELPVHRGEGLQGKMEALPLNKTSMLSTRKDAVGQPRPQNRDLAGAEPHLRHHLYPPAGQAFEPPPGFGGGGQRDLRPRGSRVQGGVLLADQARAEPQKLVHPAAPAEGAAQSPRAGLPPRPPVPTRRAPATKEGNFRANSSRR